MERYPDDNFEIYLRKVNSSSTPEWRIKCLDCPGKVRSRYRYRAFSPFSHSCGFFLEAVYPWSGGDSVEL